MSHLCSRMRAEKSIKPVESGCSPGHTPTPSPEGPSGPQGTNPVSSPTSLVPPVCLYSADNFDPLDYLTKLRQYLP